MSSWAKCLASRWCQVGVVSRRWTFVSFLLKTTAGLRFCFTQNIIYNRPCCHFSWYTNMLDDVWMKLCLSLNRHGWKWSQPKAPTASGRKHWTRVHDFPKPECPTGVRTWSKLPSAWEKYWKFYSVLVGMLIVWNFILVERSDLESLVNE